MRFARIKNNPSRQVVRLPRAGKIRLGIKVKSAQSGNEYPREVDYFVCPPEVDRVFRQDPRCLNHSEPPEIVRLRIMLPVEDDEMLLRQYYACYGGNQRLKCQGDGEKAERRIYKEVNGQKLDAGVEEVDCPGPETCDFANAPGQKSRSGPGCSARTDLMVIIPEVNMGACYQISTGSTVSDIDIRSGIEMCKQMVGRISWVPLILEREERKIPDPNTGKMQTHWPIKLMPAFTLADLGRMRDDEKRIANWGKQYALPEPEIEGETDKTPVVFVDQSDQEIEQEMQASEAARTAVAVPGVTDPAPTPPHTGPVPAASPGPDTITTEEAFAITSGEARNHLLERINGASAPELEVIGNEISRTAHLFTSEDLSVLRTTFKRAKDGLKPPRTKKP